MTTFGELAVGDKFKYGEWTYTKINLEHLPGCCAGNRRPVNCVLDANGSKHYYSDSTTVDKVNV